MGWWHQAKPGDRVVCIGWDERYWQNLEWILANGMKVPTKGAVYTIRCLGPTAVDPKRFWLRLREIVNPPLIVEGIDLGELCWPVEWFRPAVNRATDISVFTALLNTAPSSLGLSQGSADLEPASTAVDPRHEAEDDAGKVGAR